MTLSLWACINHTKVVDVGTQVAFPFQFVSQCLAKCLPSLNFEHSNFFKEPMTYPERVKFTILPLEPNLVIRIWLVGNGLKTLFGYCILI
jgi:hypothetical protein